jgi:hypothetical protein
MKNRIHHPLWTHLPAVIGLIVIIVITFTGGPLPSHTAIHFDSHGIPNGWGSPWAVFGLAAGLSLLFIFISGIIDDVYARSERKKSFNWFSLLDELVIGFLAGTYLEYVQYLNGTEAAYNFSWLFFAAFVGIAVILGVLVEFLRPARPYITVPFGDTASREQELAKQVQSNASFIYWESQNPAWISIVTILLPIVLAGTGATVWFKETWSGIVCITVAVLLVLPYGGLRTAVTRNNLSVRFGIIGLRVLNLNTGDIASASLADFNPMKDFGGYGIRMNSKMTGYYLRGSRGVLLTTAKGKKYLIGSDKPEELYAVIEAVRKNK